MAEDMPTGEKVYDPISGRERDAFPGEIIPPEQQTTMQRLIAETRAKYQVMADGAAKITNPDGTQKYSKEQLDTVLQMGLDVSKGESDKYLEAVRTNPANILVEVFKKLDPRQNTLARDALIDFNDKVEYLKRSVVNGQNIDKVEGRKVRQPSDIIISGYSRGGVSYGIPAGSILIDFSSTIFKGVIEEDDFRTILTELGAFPTSEPVSLRGLYNVTPKIRANNTTSLTTPYVVIPENRSGDDLYTFRNLQATKPGLEGVGVLVQMRSDFAPTRVVINGTVDVLCRIIERGGYSPYQP